MKVEFADFLRRAKFPGGGHPKTALLRIYIARVHHHILPSQSRYKIFSGQPPFGQLFFGGIDVDDFVLYAPELHAGDPFDHTELPFELIGIVLHFFVRKTTSGHGQHKTIDKVKII